MFQTVLLRKEHKREAFECTHESLNNYLKRQATRETKMGLARIFVYADSDSQILAYYSLSSSELPRDCVPQNLLKKLPSSYSGYPAFLIGRLAVTRSETGKGLGGELLHEAIHRCVLASDEVGSRAIIVDPIDKGATAFYEKFMFKPLPDSNRMILHIDRELRLHFGLGEFVE